MNKATFKIKLYRAVIPKIQNLYEVEKENELWVFGFKYDSGVFEYFHFTKKADAEHHFKRLIKLIDEYYNS